MTIQASSLPANRSARPATIWTSLLIAAAVSPGCASTGGDQAFGGASTLFSRAAEATTATAAKLRLALGNPDLLRRFHDAGEHGEEAVLALLRRAGISGGKPAAANKGSAGTVAARARSPSQLFDAPLAEGDLRWPVQAGVISSEFGHRWGRQHRGIDIAGTEGEPILAAADGEVLYSGTGLSGYGKAVIVRHGGQMSTLYAHNSEIKVLPGQRVRQGDVIALLGNTGRSTGPHLHFEIRRGELSLDPRTVLPPTRLAAAAATQVASK